MTKEQAIQANKEKGELVKKLRQTLGEREFKERYAGDYKGHVRKIKGLFHSNKKYKNQMDSRLANDILNGKSREESKKPFKLAA